MFFWKHSRGRTLLDKFDTSLSNWWFLRRSKPSIVSVFVPLVLLVSLASSFCLFCVVLAARVKVERPLWVSVRGQLAFCTMTTMSVPVKCPYSLCRVCPTTFRVNISGRVGRSRRKDWFWRNQRQRKELSQHKFSIEMQEKVVKRSHLPPA